MYLFLLFLVIALENLIFSCFSRLKRELEEALVDLNVAENEVMNLQMQNDVRKPKSQTICRLVVPTNISCVDRRLADRMWEIFSTCGTAGNIMPLVCLRSVSVFLFAPLYPRFCVSAHFFAHFGCR